MVNYHEFIYLCLLSSINGWKGLPFSALRRQTYQFAMQSTDSEASSNKNVNQQLKNELSALIPGAPSVAPNTADFTTNDVKNLFKDVYLSSDSDKVSENVATPKFIAERTKQPTIEPTQPPAAEKFSDILPVLVVHSQGKVGTTVLDVARKFGRSEGDVKEVTAESLPIIPEAELKLLVRNVNTIIFAA